MFPFPASTLITSIPIGRALRAVLSPPKGLASHSMYNLLVAAEVSTLAPECILSVTN